MAEMQLEKLATELALVAELGPIETRFAAKQSHSAELHDVVQDSRTAASGSLFCAVPGLTVDGHDYVAAAVSRGAEAAMVERFVDTPCAQIKVGSVRRSMAYASALVHHNPSRELAVVGVTGTNGKTTTTQLLSSIVTSAGRSCRVIGTLDGAHTTPESPELQRQLRAAADDGIDVVAIEVSSHALDQHRADATEFAVALFSNLTPDHLDYHVDMEHYFEAKARLFDGRAKVELINIDDPWGQRLAAERTNATKVSLADVRVDTETITGTEFEWRGHHVWVPLPGRMNVANALMAAESALLLGLNEAEIASGLATATRVPGRMQLVLEVADDQPTVVVDYSHTPDSIERALQTLLAVTQGSVSIVFGCGGDRDRSKRPLMASAAETWSSAVYLTNDNPRSEDPLEIVADVLRGFDRPDLVRIETDRRLAIERAIIDADPGDVVLIAGKGHEMTQTIGSTVLPFNDVQVARSILEANR